MYYKFIEYSVHYNKQLIHVSILIMQPLKNTQKRKCDIVYFYSRLNILYFKADMVFILINN